MKQFNVEYWKSLEDMVKKTLEDRDIVLLSETFATEALISVFRSVIVRAHKAAR
jgi:hypothetical protein